MRLDGGYGVAYTDIALYVVPGAQSGGTIESADGHHAALGVNMTYDNDVTSDRCTGPPTTRLYSAGAFTRPPFAYDPVVAGAPIKGETVSVVRDGYWNPPPSSFQYRWQRCTQPNDGCADIGGATSRDYVVKQPDVGRYLRARLSAAPAFPATFARSRTSNELGPVAEAYGDDRRAPDLAVSGGLWDHRNRDSDRRNEGVYDAQSSVSAVATEPLEGAGVKSIEIWFINQRKVHTTLPCVLRCPALLRADWTLDTDSVADGTYPLKVVTRDFAGNAREENWTVTVDRRGDVYSAQEYDAAPENGGVAVADEKAQIGTHNSRRTQEGEIATRHSPPCASNPTSGCGEVRYLLLPEEGEDQQEKTFSIHRGTSANDERLEEVASILETAGLGTPTSSGPLNDVLQDWQRPPPAHGGTYALYETTESVTVDGEDSQSVKRIWIEEATKMPLREQRVTDGELEEESFYTYEPDRKQRSELPSDVFAVARPADAVTGESIDYADGSTPPPGEAAPPTTEEEVADARDFRLEFGLNADLDHVRATLENPALEPTIDLYGVPLTAAEDAEMDVRDRAEEAMPQIDEYGATQAPGSYAGTFIDQAAGGLVRVGFTTNAEQHLTALRATFPYPCAYEATMRR